LDLDNTLKQWIVQVLVGSGSIEDILLPIHSSQFKARCLMDVKVSN
jgi:hypothetical protein